MSAIAAISLVTFNKGTFSYTPVGETNNIAKWFDTSGAIPLGYSKLTMSNKPVSSGGKNSPSRNKIKLLVEIPVLSQPSGTSSTGFTPAAVVGHTLRATIEFDLADISTLVQRDTIHQQLIAALSNAQFTDLVYNLGQPY